VTAGHNALAGLARLSCEALLADQRGASELLGVGALQEGLELGRGDGGDLAHPPKRVPLRPVAAGDRFEVCAPAGLPVGEQLAPAALGAELGARPRGLDVAGNLPDGRTQCSSADNRRVAQKISEEPSDSRRREQLRP
jgi:hypothetical protein